MKHLWAYGVSTLSVCCQLIKCDSIDQSLLEVVLQGMIMLCLTGAAMFLSKLRVL